MPEGVNAKVEALFAQSLSAFAVVHLRNHSLQGEVLYFFLFPSESNAGHTH